MEDAAAGTAPRRRWLILPDLIDVLPTGVTPTPVRLLECNRRFLIIREYQTDDLASPSWEIRWWRHEKLWKRLTGLDAVTVLCVWSTEHKREHMQIFDHRGMGPRQAVDGEQFRQTIRDWWREAETWPG